jgi:hypothetical protein
VLRDHAMLAGGERGIVVGPGGEYVWRLSGRSVRKFAKAR